MKSFASCLLLASLACANAYGQTCSATVGSGTIYWSSLSWSCSGGGTAPTTNGQTYNEDITINGLGASDNLVIDRSVTINGNLTINATGSAPTVTVDNNISFRVTGSVLNSNNNVRYIVNNAAVLRVDGILEGNNNTRFGGTGTIRGGTLSLGNNADCLSPCPIISFANCSSGTTGGVSNYFCATYNNAVLPITWRTFSASARPQGIALHWETTLDALRFEVEHSLDAITWEKVGSLDGANKPSYDFLHSAPEAGTNYYRVKQTTAQDVGHSPIVSVEAGEAGALLVYPNPSRQGVFWLKSVENMTIVRVYDLVGKLVYTHRAPQYAHKLDLSGYPRGTYIVWVQDAKGIKQKKIAFE